MPISFFLIEPDAYDGSEINRFFSKYPEEAYVMEDGCLAFVNPELAKSDNRIDEYNWTYIAFPDLHVVNTLLTRIYDEVRQYPDEWAQDHPTYPTGTQYLHFTKTRLLSCIAGFRQLISKAQHEQKDIWCAGD